MLFRSQENIINQNNNLYSSSTTNQNFNNSEYNFNEGNRSNVENKYEYNTYNSQQTNPQSNTEEFKTNTNYREITELVFTRIEERLKSYNVTTEDIVILKHKILSEVTEIYEKRSQIDIQKSEEKMKKEMENLFQKFLNS